VVNCASHLQDQAERLFQELERLRKLGRSLCEDESVQIGWATLLLKKKDRVLVACEPDFWGDPFNNYREDITCTLTILAKQSKLISLVGIKEAAPTFQDKFSLITGCLNSRTLYLERQRSSSPGSSGWFIFPSQRSRAKEKREERYLYQLLDYRPALLQVITLPPGYMAGFDGDMIEVIANEKNEIIWRESKKFSRANRLLKALLLR
jgi:hypothetical protein